MKGNDGIKRTGSKLIFYGLSLVVLIWTASLTVSFISSALPESFWLVPYLGLVVFDIGMIAWLFVYLYNAEGSMQRAIAMGLTITNLVGVGLITISEILLGGQTLTAAPEMLGTAAIWGVGIWTFINVAAIVGYHLSSPAARIAAAIQDEKDAVVDGALDVLRNRRQENAGRLADKMGFGLYQSLLAEIGADPDGDGIPDIFEVPGNRGKANPPAIAANAKTSEEETEPGTRPFPNGRPSKQSMSRPE